MRTWDPHTRNAMDMWKCAFEEVTIERRFRGKIFFYGLSYGGSVESVVAKGGRGLSRSTAKLGELKAMNDNLFAAHPQWVAWRQGIVNEVKSSRVLVTPFFKARRDFFGDENAIEREGLDYLPQRMVAHLINRAQ